MMTTSYPMQSHPFAAMPATTTPHWFTQTSAKRKRMPEPDSDGDSTSSDDGLKFNGSQAANPWSHATSRSVAFTPNLYDQRTSPQRGRMVKRLRRDTGDDGSSAFAGVARNPGMENGFARMTLMNATSNRAAYAPAAHVAPSPSPTIREERMKTRSWFEPEKDRIVVLDLDGSESESEDPSSVPSRSSSSSPDTANGQSNFSINKDFLSRLHSFPKPPTPPPSFHRDAGALILYKVPPLTPSAAFDDVDSSHSHASASPEQDMEFVSYERPLYASIEEVDDDDDVQMMDLDN